MSTVDSAQACATAFIGRTLARVHYTNAFLEDRGAYLDCDLDASIHDLDQGVELFMTDGSCLAFLWQWTRGESFYFLGVHDSPLDFEDIPAIDVSGSQKWKGLIGDPITDATVAPASDGLPSVPTDCRITFALNNSRVWISARSAWAIREPHGNHQLLCCDADDIVVLFEERDARRAGITL